MPTIPQSELPVPKSWDEFEDIVADLYARAWDDPHTRRYGRTGQAQQGVDICGRPARLRGRYAGVQCKRYEPGTLTLKAVEAEIAKAEEFKPPLAEYTIATTARRDARLQEAVRLITQEREAAGKFSVHIAFWEDLCSLLTHPDNNDILRKHYGDWLVRLKTVPGENLRDRELAYLHGLLKRYEFWRDHYTPLAGIAEVRAAVKDGPRLDLPMPFTPPGFEKLVEHGYGGRVEVRREPVDDLRAAVTEHRRILLLGDPGSGKTTTLWRLAYDYAQAALADGRAPLPLVAPLGAYTDDGPFDAYLARHLGPLAPYLETYCASGRLILLLDGLNEMRQAGYAERVGRIQEVLGRYSDDPAVVTCRALDYVVRLEGLQKVEVLPLDETRMRTFLHNYLGQAAGERLFWAMAGRDDLRARWDTWQRAGRTWTEFWTEEKMREDVYRKISEAHDQLWAHLQREPPPLLALGRNPYLLLMTAQVYAGAGGALPANRARLFAAFVDTLLRREEKRHLEGWVEAERQKDGLAGLAYAIQAEQGSGTTVERAWVVAQLRRAVPGCDAERLLYLATSAMLLDADDAMVRFHHQLLQEYFAARELRRRLAVGDSFGHYWPPARWWEPSGWEETVILLAGMEPDASALLEELVAVNPVVAARCLVEGGADANEPTRRSIAAALVARVNEERHPPVARVQAGDALARLGDPRPGVGVDPETGLPDILWCYVPPGPFLMGSTDDDTMAFSDEKPQHLNKRITEGYLISRYPVTNAQFGAFVAAGGYAERKYWVEAEQARVWADGKVKGLRDDEPRAVPYDFGDPFNLPNHPVVGVTWYEALAFCRWLQEHVANREWQVWLNGQVKACPVEPHNATIRLPSEAEWEKAARGTDAQRYTWGDDSDPNRANYRDTGIGTTSAVGCFPGGASPYGVEDLSGNVWEWTRSLHRGYPYDPEDGRENPGAGLSVLRVLRGGAFSDEDGSFRCASRYWNDPDSWSGNRGFRVVAARAPG